MQHILFVYGTLKRGGRWHHFLNSSQLLSSTDSIKGSMYLHENYFPLLFLGNDEIEGEIYSVPEEEFKKVVILESQYDIKIVQTTKGRIVEAFFYKDTSVKKIFPRIKGFGAEENLRLWLQNTSRKSPYYKRWLESRGGSV